MVLMNPLKSEALVGLKSTAVRPDVVTPRAVIPDRPLDSDEYADLVSPMVSELRKLLLSRNSAPALIEWRPLFQRRAPRNVWVSRSSIRSEPKPPSCSSARVRTSVRRKITVLEDSRITEKSETSPLCLLYPRSTTAGPKKRE